MSTNKMATKADLQEMYQRILPYLGGMPEVLANKFSKGDMYSTDERMIGQWIDGKPLYQKVFNAIISTSASISNTYFYEGSVPVPSGLNIDKCWVDMSMSTYLSTSNPASSRGFDMAFYEPDNNDIYFIVLYQRSNVEAQFAIKYTKTTDSPISIGNDTDYSTDEKIIGTWIDGKPLWQKTVNFGTLPNRTMKTVSAGISNLDYLVSMEGLGFSSGWGIPIPNAHPEVLGNAIYMDFDSGLIRVFTNSDKSSITNCYVTLRYTKTS